MLLHGGPPRRIWIPALLAAALALRAAAIPLPETASLPVRAYTTGDGLAGNEINAILQDSRGFLWIGTESGLSRFDGTRFVSYDTRQGLPSPNVTALLELPAGGLLVGTTGGLARLETAAVDATGRIFTPVPDRSGRLGHVTVLLADGNTVWMADEAADGGLFRRPGGGPGAFEPVRLASGAAVQGVTSLAADGAGGLWVGARTGLLHRLADGRWATVPVLPVPREAVGALLLDGRHRLWVAAADGLYALAPGSPRLERFDSQSWLAGDKPAGAILQSRDGAIWTAAHAGLDEIEGSRLRRYTHDNGLPQDRVVCLAEDRDGNLWAGTRSHGLLRIAHNGFLTYGAAGAAEGFNVSEIFEDQRSNLYVWGGSRQRPQLFEVDGEGLRNVTPEVLERAGYLGRGRHQVWMPDAAGALWLGSAAGIWRFPGAGDPAALRKAPKLFWPAPAGRGEIFRLFADSHARLWVSTLGDPDLSAGAAAATRLARWDPATGRFEPVAAVEHLGRGAPSAFAEDPWGNLWIGFSGGGLARLRGDRADLFLTGSSGNGVPAGAINDLLVDSRRRLWVASSYGGAIRFDDLDAPRPRLTAYTGAQGLASDRVLCLTEDRQGILYLGHGRGIDRLDPETGHIRALAAADDLASNVVNTAYLARDGSLWFGTPAGLARYRPEAARSEAPPPVFLSGLRIGGVPRALPPLGTPGLDGLELAPGQDQVEVRFTGISFASGSSLRYQYRLAGAAAGWSEPRTERSVLLGNLAPGAYQFLFRAVTPGGVASATPATLAFTLLRPVWQRWWFLLLAATALAALGWGLHHAQLVRAVQLERVRTRIAADLHDDLSSSLARISILSEVGRRRIADPEALEATALDQIGETARELMEAVADIVWAIDARRDDLDSLLARIRRFAGDLLEARGVRVAFASPPGAAGIALRPEARRELYLILKEALHNAARHARAQEVGIDVRAADGELVAEVRDDGVGFSPGAGESAESSRSGYGLRNLRERAARLGGILTIDSAPGSGTRVRLSLRL
jgi:signal transduction histidine kinase/ligand-binding sensor domain-containing protein